MIKEKTELLVLSSHLIVTELVDIISKIILLSHVQFQLTNGSKRTTQMLTCLCGSQLSGHSILPNFHKHLFSA